MKFGWLTLNHSPSAAEDGVAIDEQLQQACLAEALGYDSVWLTEHNFTGESVYGDPIPFASALAMKTERIRIGFAVIQMALRHPVRVATQLSVVDNLCKGRLDVGVGRGTIFNEYEFVGYGLDSSDSRERFAESLEIMPGIGWSVSHTAPSFSPEEEKDEKDNLTPEEAQAIEVTGSPIEIPTLGAVAMALLSALLLTIGFTILGTCP